MPYFSKTPGKKPHHLLTLLKRLGSLGGGPRLSPFTGGNTNYSPLSVLKQCSRKPSVEAGFLPPSCSDEVPLPVPWPPPLFSGSHPEVKLPPHLVVLSGSPPPHHGGVHEGGFWGWAGTGGKSQWAGSQLLLMSVGFIKCSASDVTTIFFHKSGPQEDSKQGSRRREENT